MKTLIKLILLQCLFITCCLSQTNAFRFEKTSTFFPGEIEINHENIEWGFLYVPENWDKPNSKIIKVAVAILKSTAKNTTCPLIYLEGGPGAGGIERIWGFLKHPLREKCDIILLDVRGTGFSFPKFCPDLGKKFLEILSKNQCKSQDEQQKIIASLACRNDLVERGIDIKAYNSRSIAKDLNALKKALNIKDWNVYGVSYGTYIVQVYVNNYPNDVRSIILDSSIPDIKNYYNYNTSNYMNSLKKVFEECKKDANCNLQYPNIEKTYYSIIEKLEKNPITVKVDKEIISSGEFTYNAEDFKIAIQQALYDKQLIEILPVLISEFNKGNRSALSSLVSAFSGALSLDYGAYYCVTCDEVIPYNSPEAFDNNALEFKGLGGGLSFYKSDFLVCDNWNLEKNNQPVSSNDLLNLSKVTVPVLVFAGEFDPITPISNGEITTRKFKNGILVKAPFYGHAPSFSEIGFKIVNDFVENPTLKQSKNEFESEHKLNFVKGIKICSGISEMANSLSKFDLLFFFPFILAVIILFFSIFCYSFSLIKMKSLTKPNYIIRLLTVISAILAISSVLGFIFAINETVKQNFYILVFGISENYNYLFFILWAFVLFSLSTILYILINIKNIFNLSFLFAVVFSLMLVVAYFQYWNFLF